MDAYTFGKYAALAKLGFAKILSAAMRKGADIPGLLAKASPKDLTGLGHYINSVGAKGVRADIWTSHPEVAQSLQNAWRGMQPAATSATNTAGGAARAAGAAPRPTPSAAPSPPPAPGPTPPPTGAAPPPGAPPGAPPAQPQQPWWKRGWGVAGASVAGGLGINSVMGAGAQPPAGNF